MKEKNLYKNILVRMPRFVGDCVMATATLVDLRKKFPKAKITVMLTQNLAALFAYDSQIDAVFVYSKPKGEQKRAQKKQIICEIRKGNFDCGILLVNSFSSAFWFWRAGIPARVGYAKNGRKLLLTHPVDPLPFWQSYHLVDQYKMVLKGLAVKRSRSLPRIHLVKERKMKIRNILHSYGVGEKDLLVGINATAASSAAKWWSAESFIELADLLTAKGLRLIFFGDKLAISRVNEICQALPKTVINMAGKTDIIDLATFIDRCNLLLSVDSGPMHIAAAVRTKVIALFGATNELISGPYTDLAIVINKQLSCSPCFLSTCPIDHRCMYQIQPHEVFIKIMESLKHCTSYESTYASV